jgi:hypothetical protein
MPDLFAAPFSSSKYLIRRAKHHADKFKSLFASFIEPTPYVHIIEYDKDTGENVYKIKLTKPVPEDLSGTGFDAINNLRSALDNAAFTIAKASVGDWIGFPIRPTEQKFEKGIRGYFNGVPAELIDIIRACKGYEGGNHLLWALNELCDTNKHNVVSPATTIVPSWNVLNKVADAKGEITLLLPYWDPIKDEVVYDVCPRGTENKTQTQITIIVSFTESNYVCFEPAVAVLDKFLHEVEGIVEALETEASRINWIV